MASLESTACHVALYSYWNGKRDSRRMPARADIDPIDLKGLLPQLMLLDILPEGFRYRLIGTRVVQEMGRDLTGRLVGNHVHQSNFGNEILAMYSRVRDSAVPLFAIGEYRMPEGATHWVSRLIMPLGADGAAADMLLLSRMARYADGVAGEAGWLARAVGGRTALLDVTGFADLVELCRAWEAGEALPSAA